VNLETIMEKRMFSHTFKRLLFQLKECDEWYNKFWLEQRIGGNFIEPFEKLRQETQELIFLFSNIFKTYSSDTEHISAINKDLTAFMSYIFNPDLGRRLNEPDRFVGEITTTVQQIGTFLRYVKIVMERTIEDVENKIPKKFVEHSLKNAGIIPSFKELRKAEEKEGE